MLKLTKTGIGLLTKQYRSVLMKCWSINIGLFTITSVLATMASNEAISEIVYSESAYRAGITIKTESTFHAGESDNGFLVYNIDSESTNNTVAWLYNDWIGGGRLDLYDTERTVKTYLSYNRFQLNNSSVVADGITASVIQNSRNLITSGGVYDALNYYYTFRENERYEAIEFAKELRSNKKEMSSLDFMPIKSSSDLRINLIKAEDPLTFSAKTRDDSLVLMEVCHA